MSTFFAALALFACFSLVCGQKRASKVAHCLPSQRSDKLAVVVVAAVHLKYSRVKETLQDIACNQQADRDRDRHRDSDRGFIVWLRRKVCNVVLMFSFSARKQTMAPNVGHVLFSFYVYSHQRQHLASETFAPADYPWANSDKTRCHPCTI